jgi:hypothetical protein
MTTHELPPCCALCDWLQFNNPLLGEYYGWECAVHGVTYKVWPDGNRDVLGMVLSDEGLANLINKLSAGVRGECK